MKSFYDELLTAIEERLVLLDYEGVLEMISEELTMPYIPREVESKLLEIRKLCISNLRYDSALKTRAPLSIEEFLNGSEEEQFMAVEQLKQSNIRSYFNVIQEYLSKEPIAMVRSLLLEAMLEQGVSDPVRLNYEGLEIEVIPTLIEPIQTSGGLRRSASYLADWLENDNPSLLHLSMQCLIKEAYLRLPLGIDEDESEGLALAVIKYIYRANGESFDVFVKANNLESVVIFDLLLTKHDI